MQQQLSPLQRAQMDALFIAYYKAEEDEARIPWTLVAPVLGVETPNDETLTVLTLAHKRLGWCVSIETRIYPTHREYDVVISRD